MSVTPAEHDLPDIISVDDHILEPRTLWAESLPASVRAIGPRVVRERVRLEFTGGHYGFVRGAEDGAWCDLWLYEDLVCPTGLLHAPAGVPRGQQRNIAAIYEDFRPGTHDQTARLADMDANHVEAAINYPNTFPRFAGQGFAERDDKALALACLQLYNDWMIDDWSGGAARGRLIPLTLVPLWDPALAAEEVRRCAAKGSYAIAFSENPSKLGFPSLYSGEWDVLWAACEETDTTVSMHIGSSSSMPATSPDAPLATTIRGRVWGCIFDDQHGLVARDAVGLESILFETDYPHSDGTWPESREVAHRLCVGAAMDADECRRLLRGNAVECYGLDRFGIVA